MSNLHGRSAFVVATRPLTLACSALLAWSCVSAPKVCLTLPSPPPAYDPVADKDKVQVTFLGVGGVIIRWQGAAVMTAPLYSNPTVGEMMLSEIHADRQGIDALMWPDVSSVGAVLSGHAHYDHLMDVPYVVLEKAMKADVVGNDEMVKILHPIEGELAKRTPPNRLVSLEDQDTYDMPGAPIRVRSVRSEHSPQIGDLVAKRIFGPLASLYTIPDVRLWRGEHQQPLAELPVRVGEWPAGTPLAFVIELLDPVTRQVAFRAYYQDTATRPPYGFPDWPKNPHPYDLAILCVSGSADFPGFPNDVVTHLQPRFVMGVHWEDFFHPRLLPLPGEKNREESLHFVPGVSEGRFVKAVTQAQQAAGRAILPCPDKTTTFARTAGGWEIAAGGEGWTAPKR